MKSCQPTDVRAGQEGAKTRIGTVKCSREDHRDLDVACTNFVPMCGLQELFDSVFNSLLTSAPMHLIEILSRITFADMGRSAHDQVCES